MKISEWIKELQDEMDKEGDIEVSVMVNWVYFDIGAEDFYEKYDLDGNVTEYGIIIE